MSHSRAQRGPKALFMFFFSLVSCSYYTCVLEASQQQQQPTPSDGQQQQQQQAAAAAADMPGDKQQPISGADPAGGIAAEEAIRDRAVK